MLAYRIEMTAQKSYSLVDLVCLQYRSCLLWKSWSFVV
jgi:hypothetical protein